MNGVRYSSWDWIFIIWFLTDSWFNHTIIGTIGQTIFMLFSISRCIGLRRINNSSFFVIYLLFCLSCYGNIMGGYSISSSRSFFMLGVIARNLVFYICLFQYFTHTTVSKFFTLFITTCCIASLGVVLINYRATGSIYMHGDNLEGSVINANIQSVINGFVIAWMLIAQKYKGKDLFFILWLFVFVIISGTRKSIISIIVVYASFMLLKDTKHLIRNLCVVSILLITLYFVLTKIPIVYDMIGSRFETMFAADEEDMDASARTRARFIEMGMYYWSQSPIWGNGLDSFGILWGDSSTYSHNNYVELLCSVGLVGCIVYYLVYLLPLLKAFRLYFKNGHREKVSLAICLLLHGLIIDYGMVTYFERVSFIPLLLAYTLLYETTHDEGEYRSSQLVSVQSPF